jgi:hypothetical protein
VFTQYCSDASIYHLVLDSWLAQWRSFVSASRDKQLDVKTPGVLDARALLCEHGGAAFSADECVPVARAAGVARTRFVVVPHVEWQALAERYGAAQQPAVKAFVERDDDDDDDEENAADDDDGSESSERDGKRAQAKRRGAPSKRRRRTTLADDAALAASVALVDSLVDITVRGARHETQPALCEECASARRASEQTHAKFFEGSYVLLHRVPQAYKLSALCARAHVCWCVSVLVSAAFDGDALVRAVDASGNELALSALHGAGGDTLRAVTGDAHARAHVC